MLHSKFQSNRPTGSGDEDVLMFLPYMGMKAYWSCDPVHGAGLCSPGPQRLYMKFGFNQHRGFRGEDVYT